MKFEKLIIFWLLFAAVALSSGCGVFVNNKSTATKTVPGGELDLVNANNNSTATRTVSGGERNFATALQYIKKGNEYSARGQLERVINGPKLSGITDEALFRLAIFNLRDEDSKGEANARKLLERLLREFPKSIWSYQADPLLEYIQDTADLRARLHELKGLRNQNLSLSRDNKELRQSIEKIKNLDMELEQKIRR